MSTYLLAFIVSKYDGRLNGDSQATSSFGVYARPEAKNVTQLSATFGKTMLDEFGVYLNFSYYSVDNIDKLDMAAIPDFSAGGEWKFKINLKDWILKLNRKLIHYSSLPLTAVQLWR